MKFALFALAVGVAVTVSVASPAAAAPQPSAAEVAAYKSPEVKAALKEFSALAARLRVGMTYQNYAEQVANLSAVLDAVPEDERKSLTYLKLSTAFLDYKIALSAWQSYVGGSGSHGFLPAESSYGFLLVENYNAETTDISGRNYIYLKSALLKVWDQAQANINKAKQG